MFHAFDPRSPGSVVELAMAILKADQKDHNLAVDMAIAVREAIISMSVAMALVTHGQNPEIPIIALSEAEENGEGTEGHNPAEMLNTLAEGFPAILDEWEILTEEFNKRWVAVQGDEVLRGFPKDFTVSDILGESTDTKEKH